MIYKFVVLSDENESFVREFEFLDRHTLLDFHNMLQDELEFDKSQMASFFTTTDNWEKEEEFTLFDMGVGSSTMESTVLEDIIFRKDQKLVYMFDFFNERGLLFEFVGEIKEDDSKDLPACTNSQGIPPKQVVFGGKSSRKQSNTIVVSDDDDDIGVDIEEIDDVEDYFLNADDEDSDEFDENDGIGEEEYDDEE